MDERALLSIHLFESYELHTAGSSLHALKRIQEIVIHYFKHLSQSLHDDNSNNKESTDISDIKGH
jgi:hypothetical protein